MSSLDQVAGGRGLCLFGLVAALPGLTLRAAAWPYTSLGEGHFYGRVLTFGTVSYGLSDRAGRPQPVMIRVRVADVDRVIARAVTGPGADSVRGSVASVRLMAPGSAPVDWVAAFVGVVVKVSWPEPLVAEFSIRVKDDQLERISPRGGWNLSRTVWPNADAEAFDDYAPVIYGYWDAQAVQVAPGLLPLVCVDSTAARWLVCAGVPKSVLRVYVNGAQVSSGTWVAETVVQAGRTYRTVRFTSGAPAISADVTADVEGYETAIGSGVVITNPAEQWAHRLSNFVLGDTDGSAWLPTNALIDPAFLAVATAYFNLLTARGVDYDKGKRTGTEVTSRYANSWRVRTFWTKQGTLAATFENIFAAPYTGRRLVWTRDELGRFSLAEEDFQLTSREVLNTIFSVSQDKFLNSFEVVDASVTNETQGQLDLDLCGAQ